MEIPDIIHARRNFRFSNLQKMKSVPSHALLKLFVLLIEEENLGRAAVRLGVPASTASRHLAELRDFFGDVLFTRSSDRLVATHRARDLFPKVQRILGDYAALVEEDRLDFSRVRRSVRIGCADNAVPAFCRHLVSESFGKAPYISYAFFPLQQDRLAQLRHGVLDFVISPLMPVEPGFHALALGTNDYVLVCAPGHPILQALDAHPDGLPDEEVLRYGFADVVFQFDRVTDAATLRDSAFPQWSGAHSVVRSAFFLPVLTFLREAPLLAVLPARTAGVMAQQGEVVIVPTRTRSNSHQAQLIWHERIHADPLMQWVRGMICTSARR